MLSLPPAPVVPPLSPVSLASQRSWNYLIVKLPQTHWKSLDSMTKIDIVSHVHCYPCNVCSSGDVLRSSGTAYHTLRIVSLSSAAVVLLLAPVSSASLHSLRCIPVVQLAHIPCKRFDSMASTDIASHVHCYPCNAYSNAPVASNS